MISPRTDSAHTVVAARQLSAREGPGTARKVTGPTSMIMHEVVSRDCCDGSSHPAVACPLFLVAMQRALVFHSEGGRLLLPPSRAFAVLVLLRFAQLNQKREQWMV